VGLYLYCVVPPGHRVPEGLKGLNDSAVEEFRAGELAVWVSRIEKPDPGVEAIRGHNAVVEAGVTEEVTPVPLRFGQWLDDEAALQPALLEKADAYQARLRQFAGCLEFGLRLLDPAWPQGAQVVQPTSATSGIEYMRALQESSRLAEKKHSQAEEVRARISELLGEYVREERVEDARTAHAVLTLSHLVARAHFEAYRERAREIRQLFPELRMLLSGPWAPYSFAV
jgi:hypothetical protein